MTPRVLAGRSQNFPVVQPHRHARNCVAAANRPSRGDSAPEEVVTLNPVELGRRSRQALDEVWAQVTRLSSPTSSFSLDPVSDGVLDDTFQTPQAQFTNVMVVGGTGRIGRILVRKLLLRGYPVKVFVRDSDGNARDRLPAAVELCVGDVGNLADCERALEGVDKVIYCASSKVSIAADMARVDQAGVGHIARAFMNSKHRATKKSQSKSRFLKKMVADFSKADVQEEWDLLHLGPLDDKSKAYKGQDYGNAMIAGNMKRLEFSGNIYSRNGIAEWGGRIEQGTLRDSEGVVMQLLGDGKPYYMILADEAGHQYSARFNTRQGFNNVRLPYNTFRPMDPASPPLDPAQVNLLKFRFDKSQIPENRAGGVAVEDERSLRNSFMMELAWIKSLPTSDEPSFVLVSCVGTGESSAAQSWQPSPSDARKIMAKRKGEQVLRNSGLPYTIVRPGVLQDEPGGYKAMVFDQGNRITQGIGCADVADVCLRALHDPVAVNKTFEVCYEYTPEEGLQMYELVAHLPDKSNNYLSPALAVLEKNT